MSRVSVVIPIYNAGKKLNKCISSILNQTFSDFELILVNDGSTDNSLDICKKYQKLDRRIILINKNNEGSIATRNKGVMASTAEYIMFVDADDWINKSTIELLYSESISNNVDISVCNMYKVIGSGTIKKKVQCDRYFDNDKVYNEDEIKNDLVTAYLHGHPFPSSLCAKLYKREFFLDVGRYVNRIHYLGDDLFYNMEIFLRVKSVKVIDKPLYYYRTGGFSSKFMPYLFDDMINGYEIQKEVIADYYQETRDRQYYGISIMLLNTFKTCLVNLFNGKLKQTEIRELINKYVTNKNVIECLYTEGSKKVFSSDYLSAIEDKDVGYLYQLGQSIYKKRILRKYFINMISKIS